MKMRDKLKSYWGIILTGVIFIFSIFCSVIGFLAVDKLASIDRSLSKLENLITETRNENTKQDGKIADINKKDAEQDKDIEYLFDRKGNKK